MTLPSDRMEILISVYESMVGFSESINDDFSLQILCHVSSVFLVITVNSYFLITKILVCWDETSSEYWYASRVAMIVVNPLLTWMDALILVSSCVALSDEVLPSRKLISPQLFPRSFLSSSDFRRVGQLSLYL